MCGTKCGICLRIERPRKIYFVLPDMQVTGNSLKDTLTLRIKPIDVLHSDNNFVDVVLT